MENASKALKIAGSVLISLMIISLFIWVYNYLTVIQKSEEEEKNRKQLQAFNQGYEAYNKKLMYGGDVLSIIHKMEDNNFKYLNQSDYQITYELDGFDIDTIEKTSIYKCTGITYSTKTGRVKSMSFAKY